MPPTPGQTYTDIARAYGVDVQWLIFATYPTQHGSQPKPGKDVELPRRGIRFVPTLVLNSLKLLGVLLACTLVVGVCSPRKPKVREAASTGKMPTIRRDPNLTERLAGLQARDGGFTLAAFEAKAALAFFTIQSAWCAADLTPARPFLSQTVYARFDLQLQEYRDRNRRNRLDGLQLQHLEVVRLESSDTRDTLHVWITGHATDYDVDAEGKAVGAKRTQSWDEEWAFVRDHSVATAPGKDLQSATCPNCGAPMAVNASGVCTHCQSDVSTGAYDWVLAEITQLNA